MASDFCAEDILRELCQRREALFLSCFSQATLSHRKILESIIEAYPRRTFQQAFLHQKHRNTLESRF